MAWNISLAAPLTLAAVMLPRTPTHQLLVIPQYPCPGAAPEFVLTFLQHSSFLAWRFPLLISLSLDAPPLGSTCHVEIVLVLRQPKVDQRESFLFSVVQKVAWLDIPVYEAQFVDVLERRQEIGNVETSFGKVHRGD